MPHLTVEYVDTLADDIKLKSMIDAVHAATNSSGLFTERDIKTRAIPLKNYRVGDTQETFVHVELRILSGRPVDEKKQLSQSLLDAVRDQQWGADQVSVDIVDMDRSSYSKY